jgi:hypothetical protein
MYPNVPTRRVGSDEPPTSVNLVNPKSATYSANISVQQCELAFEDLIATIKVIMQPLHGSSCLSIYLLI